MKITIKDTGRTVEHYGESWPVWIADVDGRRRTIEIAWCSGYVAAYCDDKRVEENTVRAAVWRVLCPDVEFTDERDTPAQIRRAIRDLSRCLEIREALRGVTLPRLKP